MKLHGYKILWITLVLVIGGVFWLRGTIFLDPDFGWHVRMGEEILARGILSTYLTTFEIVDFSN